MIDRVLETARGKVDGADALWRREEQTTVAFESGRLKAVGISEEAGVNLRVLAGGRMGVAGTTAAKPDPAELVGRARASAELGEVVDLEFPRSAASTLPRIPTFFDRTANASLAELIRMGRLLVERLSRPDCQVNVAVQRELADTAVGNTAGARGEYRATGIAVTADVTRIAGDVAGERGPGATHTPITFVHGTISPGARLELPWRPDFNALVYVLAGAGQAGSKTWPIASGQLAAGRESRGAAVRWAAFDHRRSAHAGPACVASRRRRMRPVAQHRIGRARCRRAIRLRSRNSRARQDPEHGQRSARGVWETAHRLHEHSVSDGGWGRGAACCSPTYVGRRPHR